MKTPSHLQRSRNQLHQKKCKKEHATVKQKSVPLKKVNQTEIMGTELDVMTEVKSFE